MENKVIQAGFNADYLGTDKASVKKSLANRLTFSTGKDQYTATMNDWFNVVAYASRDRLMQRWMETMRSYYREDTKRVYYLSLEFLMGRSLTNSLINMEIYDECKEALQDIGQDLDAIENRENDAGLGNGGLGRLAACFLDSLATLRLPGYGYGIRYEYGMFHQCIENGQQMEHPDNWLRYGNPWEFPRAEVLYPVMFGGHVVDFTDEHGRQCHHWVDTKDVMAMAYDTPIPGYATNTVNNMRLWSAKATRDFDLGFFNQGNYVRAVQEKNQSENLSKVLYPNDTTEMGQELRLKQQYFFVSASLQDILRRFMKHHEGFDALPDKVAIQLNDTHPSVAIPELMRLLVDEHGLEWKRAWDITARTFSYTNHTLLPEALETWQVDLFQHVLPRHMQIIYEINYHFLHAVHHRYPGDTEIMARMSIIQEGYPKRIRMSHLAIVGSHKVNGVSAIHTELMKKTIFSDFHHFYPGKIVNVTNGITPRRWLNQANPKLARLLSSKIKGSWVTDLNKLKTIESFADDTGFRDAFMAAKLDNKQYLAGLVQKNMGIKIDVNSIFDVQIKRIHEYKRQLLNVLHIIALYNRVRRGEDTVPRTFMFAGKAAPGYVMAKRIIWLINSVADIINYDPAVRGLLKVIFIPNYDVTTAMDIIPAAELSEQISTAGTEASGTGNMKLSLNGALTIGTLDGANVEIREAVGADNIFTFGHTAEEIMQLGHSGYDPHAWLQKSEALQEVLQMIAGNFFSAEEPGRFRPIVDTLLHGDQYFLLADFQAYADCQQKVAELYKDPHEWTRRAIINVANMGRFSSDRTITDYAEKIWNVHPVAHQ